MGWRRAAPVSGALAVLAGAILLGCVDGVIPDRADAAPMLVADTSVDADGLDAGDEV